MSRTRLYAKALKMVITHSILKLSIPLSNLIVQTDSYTRPLSTILKAWSSYDAYIWLQRTKKDNTVLKLAIICRKCLPIMRMLIREE